MSEEEARVLERERYGVIRSDADLFEDWLTRLKGDGTDAGQVRKARAQKRIVQRLCQEHRLDFTGLINWMANKAASEEGWS